MRNRSHEFRDCVIAIVLIVVGFALCAAATIYQIVLLQNSGLLWQKLFFKHWSLCLYSGIILFFAGFGISIKYA